MGLCDSQSQVYSSVSRMCLDRSPQSRGVGGTWLVAYIPIHIGISHLLFLRTHLRRICRHYRRHRDQMFEVPFQRSTEGFCSS